MTNIPCSDIFKIALKGKKKLSRTTEKHKNQSTNSHQKKHLRPPKKLQKKSCKNYRDLNQKI